jgi:hypothetical protein
MIEDENFFNEMRSMYVLAIVNKLRQIKLNNVY